MDITFEKVKKLPKTASQTRAVHLIKQIQSCIESGGGGDINAVDEDGLSLLVRAIRSKNLVIINWLLNKGANIEQPDKLLCDTPIFEAIRTKDLNVLKTLVARGAKLEATDLFGDTPLLAVIRKQEIDILFVEYLLKKGANVEHKNSFGETALALAARKDNHKIVDLLINKGARIVSKQYSKLKQEFSSAIFFESESLAKPEFLFFFYSNK